MRRRLAVALVVLIAAVTAGARRLGPLPALGPFLDPGHGVWSLARSAVLPADAQASVLHLDDSVTVVYDDRAVPHIFAANEPDAYRALGYVVARDRLFQLYLQTMAASGRLTEIAGPRALELDREMRGLGLPRSAERLVAAEQSDTSTVLRNVRAYGDGINAYIRQMPASELPIEFRLTGTRPTEWTTANTYHLMNRLGWTLAYLATESDRAAAASRVGTRAARALFPDEFPIQEPIQPNGQQAARFDFHPLPPPGTPDSSSVQLAAIADAFIPSRVRDRAIDAGEARGMASNNWAVSPRRSANGRALLSGDPHLDLSLPSIWYEAHLVVPGTLDVYGVTIPGAGEIVIGFNRDVAWTFTNTSADVLDYYAEQVDDDEHPTRYRLDDAWRPLERRVEVYRGQHGETIATDTLYFTHRGPMRRVRGRWTSMRWTVLEAGHELNAFHDASHARSTVELMDGFARWFQAPPQNVLAADRGGHIAIRSTGRFPVRPGDGSGAVLRDGTRTASDWTGALSVAEYPQSLDPAQGYLASANQQPVDPRVAHGWWGGNYDPWRAMRINTLLRADSSVTSDAMRRYQTDPGSARADLFMPYFLAAAQRMLARGNMDTESARLSEAAGLLAQWDRRYTRDNRRAVLFEAAMQELVSRTWDELAVTPGSTRRVATPSSGVMAELLADSASIWWDNRSTPRVERRDDILAASLVAALAATRAKYGDPNGEDWRWNRIRHANVNHLLRLPALSALDIPVQGGPETLSPSAGSGTHGASWRMVVELGPQLRAWSTYPGGQSGNPVSPRYLDRLKLWTNGELEPVRIPSTPDALDVAHRSAILHLRPAR
jgi:penicillin G amidase